MREFIPIPGFGSRLREIQATHVLSQKEMAQKIGIHVNSLQKYQAEKKNPDAGVVADVCQMFGVSADWLLLGEGNLEPGHSAPIIDAGKRISFNRAFIKLGDSKRRMLRSLMAVLLRLQSRDRFDLLDKKWAKQSSSADLMEHRFRVLRWIELIEWEAIGLFAIAQTKNLSDRLGEKRKFKTPAGGEKQIRKVFREKLKELAAFWETEI